MIGWFAWRGKSNRFGTSWQDKKAPNRNFFLPGPTRGREPTEHMSNLTPPPEGHAERGTATAPREPKRNFSLANRPPRPHIGPAMKTRTKISWCDFTLNAWEGCTKVSDGCKHCYAEDRDSRYHGGRHWGPGAPRRKSMSALKELATINRRFGPTGDLTLLEDTRTLERWIHNLEPAPAGTILGETTRVVKPQVFSMSLGDILDPEAPAEWLAEWLAAIAQATALEFMLLTKRPEEFHRRMKAAMQETTDYHAGEALEALATVGLPHIAWGVTVEDAKTTNRIAMLGEIPCRTRFVSCEPLLGDPNLGPALFMTTRQPNLVITGGESGAQGRPMNPTWINKIALACHDHGIPHHFKQWGTWAPAAKVELDDNQRNPGNRQWVTMDGRCHATAPGPDAALPAVAMHRTRGKIAIRPQDQPRLIFQP